MSDLPSQQIKITLPNELYMFLKSKADKFGLTMASYVKNLVINDVQDMDIPVFKMSAKTEREGLKALREHELGKTTEIKNIDDFLDSL